MVMEDIVEMLIRHEGLRLKPYRDSVGKLTIGVGRNLDDCGITSSEARYLLLNDLRTVEVSCTFFPWWKDLDGERKKVILNMMFNLGATRFSKFKKMIEYIAAGEYSQAATEMLNSTWAKQVGSRATELADIMRG